MHTWTSGSRRYETCAGGCQDGFLARGSARGDIHGAGKRFCGKGQRTFGLQAEKESPWA